MSIDWGLFGWSETTHLVSENEVLFTQPHTSTKTFGDTEPVLAELTGELEANAPKTGAALVVDTQTGCEFGNYIVKVPGLQARRRRLGTTEKKKNSVKKSWTLSVERNDCWPALKKNTYFPCMGSQIQATGCPDCFTACMWPGRCASI